MNVRSTNTSIKELNSLVDSGMFRNRTEAVNEGIRLLIRRYEAMKIADTIDTIAKENYGEGRLTDALFTSREEEEL